MNRKYLLQKIVEESREVWESKHDVCRDIERPNKSLIDIVHDLDNWKGRKTLPTCLPTQDSDELLHRLRAHFNDDVTYISLIMNYYFPEQFIFYRKSELDYQIREGLEFFSEVVPEFLQPFSRGKAFESYLVLNEVLLRFARDSWPEVNESAIADTRQNHIPLNYFLYRALPELFLEKSTYNRYWLLMAGPENYQHVDNEIETTWSGRRDMSKGDLAFMYCKGQRGTSRRRSWIRDIYEVADEPYFQPWGPYKGFWVNLRKISHLERPITFREMKDDKVLGQWGYVRSQLQGVTVGSIPHAFYNALLNFIPVAVRKDCDLVKEPLAPSLVIDIANEKDFEEQIIAPMLKRWGLKYECQYSCRFYYGMQSSHTRVDFYVKDELGPLTLFENKFRILNIDKDLAPALNQAKSYALQLGLPSFVVASPEGIWVYSLNKNIHRLEREFSPADISKDDSEVLGLIKKIRKNRK